MPSPVQACADAFPAAATHDGLVPEVLGVVPKVPGLALLQRLVTVLAFKIVVAVISKVFQGEQVVSSLPRRPCLRLRL